MASRLFAAAALLLAAVAAVAPADARRNDYDLAPQEIADGVYALWGLQEQLTNENGGNIVNTGFIVGAESVLVIDTGPTMKYAEEMIGAIRKITDKPIRTVIITHHHPDHAFGLKAFKKINANVLMHPGARRMLAREGEPLRNLMETLIGIAWVARTEVDRPTGTIRRERSFDLGGRRVKVIPFAHGHTPGDLIVLDEATGTLFAGDLVFHRRAPTVPHADVDIWLDQLKTLAGMTWTQLVPGHGPLVHDRAVFAEMSEYLRFLRDYAQGSVAEGDTLAESLRGADLARFGHLTTLETEFQRSMLTLFRKFETEQFDAATPAF